MTRASPRPGRRRSITLTPESGRLMERLLVNAGPGPDSRFAYRRRRSGRGGGLRRPKGARRSLRLFAHHARGRRGMARRRVSSCTASCRISPSGRCRMSGEGDALREALGWVRAAFVGDPQDVRSWATLDPLAPHAPGVAERADEAGIAAPTGGLFNQLALLSKTEGAQSTRPSRSIAARSRSTRRASGRSIPTSRPTSAISRNCFGQPTARRGRAAHSPRARDRGGEEQARSSQCRDPPHQSRGIAPGDEPSRRSRKTGLSARAGDLREELWVG